MLNYDLTDDQQDGEPPAFHYVQSANKNSIRLVGTGTLNKGLQPRGGRPQRSSTHEENESPPLRCASSDLNATQLETTDRRDSLTDDKEGGFEALHSGPRFDKAGNTRSKQRARKLQLGDIDWYGKNRPPSAAIQTPHERREGEQSLDQFVVDKRQSTRGRDGSSSFRRGGSRQTSTTG